jgi:hypothetical protein
VSLLEYGVEAPPKWQLVSHLIFAFGAIGLGYLYWGISGAIGGYIIERVVSKIIWLPYDNDFFQEE